MPLSKFSLFQIYLYLTTLMKHIALRNINLFNVIKFVAVILS